MPTVNNTVNGPQESAFYGVAQGAQAAAIFGQGAAVGVRGDGATWHGVAGTSSSTTGGVGVYGGHTAGGSGVIGESAGWIGVYGKTDSTTGGAGVWGEGVAGGAGVVGKSQHWHGVYGETSAGGSTGAAAVWGENKSDGSGLVGHSVNGAGIYAKSDHGSAAVFDGKLEVRGDISVTGDILLVAAADLAEQFDISGGLKIDPGTVVVIDGADSVKPSNRPYDRKVAGVVSGGGSYRPGILLDAQDRETTRQPLALVGKVFCKVDASYAPIDIGDLLTTSPTVGHAMKVTDAARSVGAVIGKAMANLQEGVGLVPILVTLQ
jgi:hypothetical protein